MQYLLFNLRPLILLLLSVIPLAVAGQTRVSPEAPAGTPAAASTLDWETLRPAGEEFSVLMPKGSTFESRKEPYHRMELNTRVYLSNAPAGPVFAVVSLSGIKSNPAMYSEMQRVNSYVDAFKNLFSPRIRKGAIAKLTLVREKTLQGNPGREYRMTLGELSGVAEAFATRKRFYAIVYLNSKKEDSLQDQFLGSFVIPERFVESPATVAAQSSPTEVVNAQPPVKTNDGQTTDSEAIPNPPNDTKPNASDPSTPQSGKRAPISGGVLNGKALSFPTPEYPPEAKAAGVHGTVVVQVTVDEQGDVITAQAVSGPPALQKSAANAAFRAKFSPTLLMGEPVKVTGVLLYNF